MEVPPNGWFIRENKGKSQSKIRMMTRGTPISGNPHMIFGDVAVI